MWWIRLLDGAIFFVTVLSKSDSAKYHDINEVKLAIPPVKNSIFKEPFKDRRKPVTLKNHNFCLQMDSPSAAQNNTDMVFVLDIKDLMSQKHDENRFGKTSFDRGKQSLDMNINLPETGDLLRSRQNLRNGLTFIQANAHGHSRFEFCFINLVYDSSWKAINTDKIVHLKISNEQLMTKEYRKFIQKHITQETLQNLQNIIQDNFKLINDNSKSIGSSGLLELERQKRDLNENTFNWLVRTLGFFATFVVLSNVYVVYKIYRLIKLSERKTQIN